MMDWINKYLTCRYVDGGRTDSEMDCWQMVRTVRHRELGMKLLPSYGDLRNTDPRAFTKAYSTEAAAMQQCEPEHGAIAAVLHGKVCIHVALVLEVDGRLYVLEINPTRGARFLTLAQWQRDHLHVTFHRDAQ